MIQICANMPTMRVRNWPIIRANFSEMRAEAVGKVEFIWQPVIYADEWERISQEDKCTLMEEWIIPLIIPKRGRMDRPSRVNRKLHEGICNLNGEDVFVWSISDDNLMPRTILATIANNIGSKQVFVCSQKRGQRTVDHGCFTLTAAPENCKIYYVCGDQFLIHMNLMDDVIRCFVDEGALLERIYRQYPEQFVFMPDIFIPFNALDQRRWDVEPLMELLDSDVMKSMLATRLSG